MDYVTTLWVAQLVCRLLSLANHELQMKTLFVPSFKVWALCWDYVVGVRIIIKLRTDEWTRYSRIQSKCFIHWKTIRKLHCTGTYTHRFLFKRRTEHCWTDGVIFHYAAPSSALRRVVLRQETSCMTHTVNAHSVGGFQSKVDGV